MRNLFVILMILGLGITSATDKTEPMKPALLVMINNVK